MAEHRNGLLDELVGRAVTVARLKPPDFTEEHFEGFRADPQYTTYGPVRAIRTAYVLVSHEGFGLVLRHPNGDHPHFLPWGAVIQVEDGLDGRQALVG